MKKSTLSLWLLANLILSFTIFAGGELYLQPITQSFDDETFNDKKRARVIPYGEFHPILPNAAALSPFLKNTLLGDGWKQDPVVYVPNVTDYTLACLITLLEKTAPFLASKEYAAQVFAEERDLLWNKEHRDQLVKMLNENDLRKNPTEEIYILKACEYLNCEWLFPVMAQYIVEQIGITGKKKFSGFILGYFRFFTKDVTASIFQKQLKKLWYLRHGTQKNDRYKKVCEFDLQELIDSGKVEIRPNQHKLDLSRWSINRLQLNFPLLANLRILNLSFNKLQTLPPDVTALANLKSLDLSVNQLQTFPLEITDLPNLEKLGFAGNDLQEIPPEIKALIKLKELNFAYNNLQQVPSEVRILTHLEKLDLTGNSIKQRGNLPPCVIFEDR